MKTKILLLVILFKMFLCACDNDSINSEVTTKKNSVSTTINSNNGLDNTTSTTIITEESTSTTINSEDTTSTTIIENESVFKLTLDSQEATIAGTTAIYLKYNTGLYLERICETKINSSTSGIECPKKIGYSFLGYNTEINGNGQSVFSEKGLLDIDVGYEDFQSAPATLYAIWKPQTYTITYNDMNGKSFSGEHSENYPTVHTYNTVTKLVSPSQDYRTFVGWYDTPACNGDSLTELKATEYTYNITLYAKWSDVYSCYIEDLVSLLEVLSTSDEPYKIRMLDNNPSISVISSILKSFSDIFVDLDLSICGDLTTIKSSAFRDCVNLTGIQLPDNLTTIGFGAFDGCNSLESITIPFVGYDCYERKYKRYSPEATQYYFGIIFGTNEYPGSIKTIGISYLPTPVSPLEYDYYYIPTSLKTVRITSGSRIYDYAFRFCSGLTSVIISDSVTSIGDYAFQSCSGLTSIDIPDSVTVIGSRAFHNCTGLTSVTIPDSVTSLGEGAFLDSCLTSVTIGSGVTSIGSDAFITSYYDSTHDLLKVKYCGTLEQWCKIDCGFCPFCYFLLYIDGLLVTDIIIPNAIYEIKQSAFRDCRSLIDVVIHDNIISIGDYAFYDCELDSVTVRAIVPPSLGTDVFYIYGDNGKVKTPCKIYVPAASVEAYKSADGWSEYASQIYAIED